MLIDDKKLKDNGLTNNLRCYKKMDKPDYINFDGKTDIVCKECGLDSRIILDHIITKRIRSIYSNLSKEELDKDSNLQYLCLYCNTRKAVKIDKKFYWKFQKIDSLCKNIIFVQEHEDDNRNIICGKYNEYKNKLFSELREINTIDLFQHFAFKNGRLRVNNDDIKEAKNFLMFVLNTNNIKTNLYSSKNKRCKKI